MRITLKDFTGGINRATDPTKMKENEFYDFQNLVIYKLGAIGNAVKRYGLERYQKSDVSLTSIKPKQIYQYVTNSKSVNVDRIIVQDPDGKLYYATYDADYQAIHSSGESTGKVKFLTVRDNLYILNRYASGNYMANLFYDGTTYKDMGLPPCRNNFNIEIVTAGNRTVLPSGYYRYIVTFVYDGLQESYFLPNSDHSSSTGDQSVEGNSFFSPTTGTDKFAFVNMTTGVSKITLPTGNSRVTARRIYRTKKGGTQFYFLAEINDNTTVDFIDDKPDSILFEPIDVQAIFKPPIAKYGVFHKDRFFLANLRENIYTYTPDTDTILLTPSHSTGGSLTVGGKYKYRLYYLYLYPTLNSGQTGTPLQGFLGKPITLEAVQLNGTENRVNIQGIGNSNDYSGQVLVERNCSSVISNFQISTNVCTVTVSTGTGTNYKVGESITISDVASPYDYLNGTRVVISTEADKLSFGITHSDVTSTAITGVVEGGNFYYVGVTASLGTTYLDELISDSELIRMDGVIENNGIEKISSDKILPSTMQWSDVGYTDSFPPDNSIEVEANDGDVITGIVPEDDGVLIFKERNIYKLYTDRESSYWMLRKVVSNVGCTDPFSIVTISVNTHLFTSNGQIYLYSNGQVRKISEKIQPIIDGFGTLSNTDVCFDPYRNWVIWTYQYTESSTTVQDMIVLDLNFPQDGNIGSWYYFKHYVNLSGTPTRDGLTVSSPIVTKDGKLLFGSTTKEILQYGKTPQYKDTYLLSGVSTDRSIEVLLTKYFDFDEWTMERVMGKFRLGGAGTVSVATSTGSGTKTTTGSDTKVRVNKKISRSATKVQEDYISVLMPENVSLEIKEVGFDYEIKHQERGSF